MNIECNSKDNDQENLADKKDCKKNPFVLTSKRYKTLLDSSKSKERRIKQDAEDEDYKKVQKEAGEALTAKYTGKKQATLNEKLTAQRAEAQKNSEEASKFLKKYKESDEKLRLEKIARAEELMESTKPGARQLKSAAITSEVLRERNVQMAIKKDFEEIVEKENTRLITACVSLNNPWIPDNDSRVAEKMDNINNYKKDLLKTIEDHLKQKYFLKKHLISEEQAERDRVDSEIKEQIEKERIAMEKKRAILRKNAVEAMKMVEQRRHRDNMVDEAEDRLNCVFNKGKRELNEIVKAQMEQIAAAKIKKIEECAKKVAAINIKKENENERLERDINKMKLKFTEAEMEKKRKEKAAKQARIEAHLLEVERQKKFKKNCCELQRFEMAQRFKNNEVNCLFELTKKQERLRGLEQFRTMLKEQMAEKSKREKATVECIEDDPYIKDDEKFFALARQYIEDSKKKDRPLYPFIKAIENYKRLNNVDCTQILPKHLLSQISIGCRKADDKKDKKINDRKQKVLEECLQINKMLTRSTNNMACNMGPNCLENYNNNDNNRRIIRGAGGETLSIYDCLSGTNMLTKYKSATTLKNCTKLCCPDTLDCEKCNKSFSGRSRKSLINDNKDQENIENEKTIDNNIGDNNVNTDERKKLRYSMCHLKYINQSKNHRAGKNRRIWY